MKPYDLEDWVDYVRGLREPSEREAMTQHLAAATDDSISDLRLLESVREALCEELESPPENLSWTAKAIAGVQPEMMPEIHPLELISAYPPLVQTDSRRHIYLGARKLLYQGERFDLDVWMEDPQGTQASVVMGQVSLRGDDHEMKPVEGASVFLIEGGEVAGSTLTNRFGEFHIEASPEGQLGLQILLRDQGRVELSLPREEP